MSRAPCACGCPAGAVLPARTLLPLCMSSTRATDVMPPVRTQASSSSDTRQPFLPGFFGRLPPRRRCCVGRPRCPYVASYRRRLLIPLDALTACLAPQRPPPPLRSPPPESPQESPPLPALPPSKGRRPRRRPRFHRPRRGRPHRGRRRHRCPLARCAVAAIASAAAASAVVAPPLSSPPPSNPPPSPAPPSPPPSSPLPPPHVLPRRRRLRCPLWRRVVFPRCGLRAACRHFCASVICAFVP